MIAVRARARVFQSGSVDERAGRNAATHVLDVVGGSGGQRSLAITGARSGAEALQLGRRAADEQHCGNYDRHADYCVTREDSPGVKLIAGPDVNKGHHERVEETYPESKPTNEGPFAPRSGGFPFLMIQETH